MHELRAVELQSVQEFADRRLNTLGSAVARRQAPEPFRVRVNRTGRRTYSREYKLEIVSECNVPGVSVAAIAVSHGINANLVRRWIVQHRSGRLCPASPATQAMLPVTLAPTGKLAPLPGADLVLSRSKKDIAVGVIEIELDSARIRVRGAVHSAALRTVLELLAKRRSRCRRAPECGLRPV